jgi:WD40 repeat protein
MRLRLPVRCPASAQAHDGKLRSVAWASPVFGSILASCADDGAVKVWLIQPAGEAKLLATLGGGRAAPVCIAFSPQHQGLVLAVACADGAVRLYESADRTGAAWEEQVSVL